MLKQRFRNYEIAVRDQNNYVIGSVRISPENNKDGTPNEIAGEEFVTVLGFYNSIESAVKQLAKWEANERDTLKEWLEEYRAVVAELEELLTGHREGKQ